MVLITTKFNRSINMFYHSAFDFVISCQIGLRICRQGFSKMLISNIAKYYQRNVDRLTERLSKLSVAFNMESYDGMHMSIANGSLFS